MQARDYDIVIVGGGMVGASMACALKDSNYKIAVIEAFQPSSTNQPSFDERTVALTFSSKLIFNAIGAWSKIRDEAYPILNIDVTNQDSFGYTTLGVNDIDTQALGYVVPTRCIGKTLHGQMSDQSNLDVLCPAKVESIQTFDSHCLVTLSKESESIKINTRLVILADGGRSNLLDQLGFKTTSKTYPQCALVGIISTNQAHHGKAYEHFTNQGPLALLPLRTSDFALAWTITKNQADNLIRCSESDFVQELQFAFGRRAGLFKSVGQRHSYPLSLTLLDNPIQKRTVVIGNAAHTLHPVAGQGFNLGLRDVGFLHDILLSSSTDPGNIESLNAYYQLRKHDTKMVSQFTDGMINTFNHGFLPVKAARNLGLSAINILPGIKKSLLKRTMGLHGRQSRLAMLGKSSMS